MRKVKEGISKNYSQCLVWKVDRIIICMGRAAKEIDLQEKAMTQFRDF